MVNGVNIRDLNGLEASTSQLQLIGFTVLWRLAGIRVSHSDLEQALQAAGFEKYLPDPPTPRVALRRALGEWIKAKQQTVRTLQLQLGDEEQEENGAGRRRTLIRGEPLVIRILLANVCRERARARCCSRDGGSPSEAGLQEQASNNRKLRWSRAIVVNVTEKGVANTSCRDQRDERK